MKTPIRILTDLAPGWRLGADELQWLVLKWRHPAWRRIAFVATNKQVLMRIFQEYGIPLSREAQSYVNRLPEGFRDGRAGIG